MRKSQTTKTAEKKGQKMVKTTIRVPETLWKAAKICAVREEVSVQDIVVRGLHCYVIKGVRS
jgi:hypothetical protein